MFIVRHAVWCWCFNAWSRRCDGWTARVAFDVPVALLIQRRVGRVQSWFWGFGQRANMHGDGGTTELDGAMHGRVPARPFTCVRCSATQLGLLSKDTSASSYKSRSANCCHGLAHSGQQIVVEERTTFFISILGSDGPLKFYSGRPV
jgi:hypothetical protein